MDKAMKDALIERAARAICKRNGENWSRITVAQCDAYRADATAALEATGVFDLVEAVDATPELNASNYSHVDVCEVIARVLGARQALNAMEQSNDPA